MVLKFPFDFEWRSKLSKNNLKIPLKSYKLVLDLEDSDTGLVQLNWFKDEWTDNQGVMIHIRKYI